MKWTSRRTAVVLLVLVGLTLAGAALLGPGHLSTQPLGPAGSAASSTDARSNRSDPSDNPTMVSLGDLRPPRGPAFPPAPIDPCTVVDRADLPAEVRPAEDPARTPEQPADEQVGCRMDYRTGPGPVALVITIAWTAPAAWPGQLEPAIHLGAEAAMFGGRPGLERAAIDAQGDVACLGLMPVGAGTASVRVVNSRFPTVHPCVVATAVLTAIAHKTS